MKNVFSTLIFSSLLVATPAFAAENGLRAKIASTTERVKEAKMEIKERIEDRKASTTARRLERRDDRTLRLVKHAGEVLSATADRLEKIGTRIESRIAKVKAAGGDTTASENALAQARVHIVAARTKLSAFSTADLSAEKFSDTVAKLREAAAGVKDELKAARSSLSEAINSLKPGRATSTASTTQEEN